ncbi:hypothetical protein, partial [Campylobacter jejuni]|uniref:hypothetical protein n=1 Tax=Campylobacter jejuni TaxID=197 RepID=UPI001F08D09E
KIFQKKNILIYDNLKDYKLVKYVFLFDRILLKNGYKILIDLICKSVEIIVDTSSLNGESIKKLIKKENEI